MAPERGPGQQCQEDEDDWDATADEVIGGRRAGVGVDERVVEAVDDERESRECEDPRLPLAQGWKSSDMAGVAATVSLDSLEHDSLLWLIGRGDILVTGRRYVTVRAFRA
jgi:hypothetical protein